jgi:hypothetical protein
MAAFTENAHSIAFSIFAWFAVLYILMAIGYIIWNNKIRKNKE